MLKKFTKLLVVLFFCQASIAFSDTLIEQTVITEIGKEKASANYTWKIKRNKFRLDIQSNKGEVTYLFNGRIFYVCSKVSAKLIKLLLELNIKDKTFLANLKKGSCQSVPANFMARFFLSPAGAISTLDYSDGMQLTLGMDQYKFKPLGNSKELKTSCKKAKREFTVNRKFAGRKGSYQNVSETVCYSSKHDWRSGFWRQVSRDLIRQPGAKGLYKTLKKDIKNLNGFVLSSVGTFEKTGASGHKKTGTRSTTTNLIKTKKMASREYKIPAGYAVVDIQQVILASRLGDYKGGKNYNPEKDPVPVFLYHILGGGLL